MKTKIEIEFETSNMNEVREDVDGGAFTGPVMTDSVEKELHKAFKSWLLRTGWLRDTFEEDLRDCNVGEGADETVYLVEDFDILEDYGTVSIKVDGKEV